jgi:hypothetical protein
LDRAELEQRLDAFLTAANDVVRLGVREHIEVRQLIFSSRLAAPAGAWDSRDLGDRVAALLARSPAELERLQRLFHDYFSARERVSWIGAPRGPRGVGPIVAKVKRLGRLWRALVASTLVAVVACVWLLYPGPELPSATPPPRLPAPTQTPPDELPTSPTGPRALTVARSVSQRVFVIRRFAADDLWSLIFAFPFLILATRLELVIVSARMSKSAEHSRRLAHSRLQRMRLSAESAERGEPNSISYHVPLYVPLQRGELDDIATALGRVRTDTLGRAIDASRTVDATVNAAGRFVPVLELSRSSRMLLVLIDIEQDDYPWLGAIERTLGELRRRGITFSSYRFKHRPVELYSARGGGRVDFGTLCRRYADASLIIISRGLDPRDFDQQPAAWLKQLPIFQRRAWLDPDPRPLSDRGRYAHAVLEFERVGLVRYPFSSNGWLALAKYLSSPTAVHAPVDWPPLPSVEEKEAALRAWVLTAALVPDATWDQLEAIRRDPSFPEIGRELDKPCHLQLLLHWTERFTGQLAVSGDGRTLALPETKVHELIVEQRARDKDGRGEPLEARARRMLLRQLEPEQPVDSLTQLKWQLKRASHEMVLDPSRAETLFQSFIGTPIEEMATAVLLPELERQEAGSVLRGREPAGAALARARSLTNGSVAIEWRTLFFWHWRLYVYALLIASGLCAILGLSSIWISEVPIMGEAFLSHPVDVAFDLPGAWIDPAMLATDGALEPND